jgi:hypothetical protein
MASASSSLLIRRTLTAGRLSWPAGAERVARAASASENNVAASKLQRELLPGARLPYYAKSDKTRAG